MPLFKRSPAKQAAAAGEAAAAAGPSRPASGGDAPLPPPPLDVSPSALAFSSSAPPDQEQARTLTIANRSPTLAIAFKVKCSNRDAYTVDVASGVLAPLAARRVRVFRLGRGGAGAAAPSPSDAFCVTAQALPADTPLPEAAAAALTGRMGDGAVDVLVPVHLAPGLLDGGPPPLGVARAAAAGAAAGVAPSAAVGPLLQAFATYLASQGLVDDLGGALAAAGEVEKAGGAAAAAAAGAARGRRGGAPVPTPASPTPPTPTPTEHQPGGGGGGTAVGSGGEAGERGGDGGGACASPPVGTPPVSATVPAFAERVALFEGGARGG